MAESWCGAAVGKNVAVRRWSWWLVAAGLVTLAASAALMLWPLDEPGVSGNALRPEYRDFGWFSYQPLPEHPSVEDFHRAGITLPQDYVAERRRIAAVVAAMGIVVLTTAVVSRRRPAS